LLLISQRSNNTFYFSAQNLVPNYDLCVHCTTCQK